MGRARERGACAATHRGRGRTLDGRFPRTAEGGGGRPRTRGCGAVASGTSSTFHHTHATAAPGESTHGFHGVQSDSPIILLRSVGVYFRQLASALPRAHGSKSTPATNNNSPCKQKKSTPNEGLLLVLLHFAIRKYSTRGPSVQYDSSTRTRTTRGASAKCASSQTEKMGQKEQSLTDMLTVTSMKKHMQ